MQPTYGNHDSYNITLSGRTNSNTLISGFPTDVENRGGSSEKFDGEGAMSIDGEAWGLKILSRNTCEGVHLIVNLQL